MNDMIKQTLASIATKNHHAVQVFEKYNLDFCCKGNKSLSDACAEKGLAPQEVISEIETASEVNTHEMNAYSQMGVEELVDHIVNVHHHYVKATCPIISAHLSKVSMKHGANFPYMIEVEKLFEELQNDFMDHMNKEEFRLFPWIKTLADRNKRNLEVASILATSFGPIHVMMLEHEQASDIMEKIKKLTNHFTPPAGACTTFRITMEELKEFEADMHVHVHLENNILFERTRAMAKSDLSNGNSCSL